MTLAPSDHDVGPIGPPELSRPVRRLMRRYAARLEAVGKAESGYRDTVLLESLRHGGTMKRSSYKRVEASFEALVDAVIDLQTTRAEVVSLAAREGLSPEAVGSLDRTLGLADGEYAGYLSARTYDQVREVVRRPLVGRRPQAARDR